MEIALFVIASLILAPFLLAIERVMTDFLPSLTREAKYREKKIVAMVKVRNSLDNRIKDEYSQTSNYSRRRIERNLGKE